MPAVYFDICSLSAQRLPSSASMCVHTLSLKSRCSLDERSNVFKYLEPSPVLLDSVTDNLHRQFLGSIVEFVALN